MPQMRTFIVPKFLMTMIVTPQEPSGTQPVLYMTMTFTLQALSLLQAHPLQMIVTFLARSGIQPVPSIMLFTMITPPHLLTMTGLQAHHLGMTIKEVIVKCRMNF